MTSTKENALLLTQGDLNTAHNLDNKMCSGFGQYQTDKHGKVLSGISYAEICRMAANPPSVEKAQAQWIIASTHRTRSFLEQQQHGSYALLWADFDDEPKPIAEVATFWRSYGCQGLFYSSRSATQERPKSRLIVPLDGLIGWADYSLAAECLNDLLEGAGFKPDRANQRAAQLCYLPNRGEHYEYTQHDGELFDPLKVFADELAQKKQAIVDGEREAQKRREAAEANRQAFKVSGSTSAVEAFNACHSVDDVLLKAGYDQRGSHFRHPNSESGSFSASVKDGRVFSLSPADPLHSEHAHDAFSAWVVLFWGGDANAAAKHIYQELRRAA